jgi:hypothetical protein
VIGTRWTWTVIAALVVAAPVGAGNLFGKRPKTDAQVKRLTETVRTDADELRRQAAIAELRDADPRTHPDVIPALVAALQRDRSARVRADAAEAIGQFKLVLPLAGLALETAAESDPVRAVRDSAHQALWELHLAGYRSAKGADGFAGQTPEPPIARPGPPRPAATLPRVTTSPVVTVSVGPPPKPEPGLPTVIPTPPTAGLVSSPRPAPRLADLVKRLTPPHAFTRRRLGPTLSAAFDWQPAPASVEPASVGPKVILTATPPPLLNVTAEPPIAGPRVLDAAPSPRLLADTAEVVVPTFPVRAASSDDEVIMLPAVSAPPGPPLELPHHTPAAVNEIGPRVEAPAVRVITGLDRFKHPE